jgi:LysR family transcriptional regulator, glycine cleavage system transcriptional activator
MLMTRKIPFLNGARAFEVAARLGSIKDAASELNVTPAAVSRMVKLLEERLGVLLFQRTANRLVLTPAGKAYQPGLTQIFDALSNLTEQVTSLSKRQVLTVGVGPTFATKWLIPRLGDFQKTAPEIDVHIATGGVAAPFSDDWTCGITLGDGNWPDLTSEAIVAADLTPICTASIGKKIKTVVGLRKATLLRVSHSPDDWKLWLKAASVTGTMAKGPEFDFYGQAQQAAVDGLGVAMGIRPYIDDDLAAGRLVAPFEVSVPKGVQWHLLYKPHRVEDPAFQAFRDWLVGLN